MKTFEIYTGEWSEIVQAENIQAAIHAFYGKYGYEPIIAIEDKGYQFECTERECARLREQNKFLTGRLYDEIKLTEKLQAELDKREKQMHSLDHEKSNNCALCGEVSDPSIHSGCNRSNEDGCNWFNPVIKHPAQ